MDQSTQRFRIFPVLDSVFFMSMCPNCKDMRSQRAFSNRTLLRLLELRLPIEAYCVVCDDFWQISVAERDALAQELANGRDHPR